MNTESTFPPITVIDCLQNRLPKKRTSPFRKEPAPYLIRGRLRGIYHYFERPESPLVPLFQRGRSISADCLQKDERFPQSIFHSFVPFGAPVTFRRDADVMSTSPRTEKTKMQNRQNNETTNKRQNEWLADQTTR